MLSTQHLHRIQRGMRMFTAGIRFERIIINLIYTIIQPIRQFFQMRLRNHCPAEAFFAFQYLCRAGKTSLRQISGKYASV